MSGPIKDSSVETFLAELASQAATPGGGSAAAVIGATGAALASMVCRLTIGKPKYKGVEAELQGVLDEADRLRETLIGMIEQDVVAFDTVMAAYGMPKSTEAEADARTAAVQSALRVATQVPLDCARACRDVIRLAAVVSEKGNRGVISDGGVAVLAGYAALRSAALNVYVNAKAITDRAFAEAALAELAAILADAGEITEATYAGVKQKLS